MGCSSALRKFSEKTRLKGVSKIISLGTTGTSGIMQVGAFIGLFALGSSALLMVKLLPIIGSAFAILFIVAPDTYNALKYKLKKNTDKFTQEQKEEIQSIITNAENGDPLNLREFVNNEPDSARTIYNNPRQIDMSRINRQLYNHNNNINNNIETQKEEVIIIK